MSPIPDSWKGDAQDVHRRDGYKCVYCGLDGTSSFESWLALCCDHLLPAGDPNRDNVDYIVTACAFCNTVENKYFSRAEGRGIALEGRSRKELVEQKLSWVEKKRDAYCDYWMAHVQQRR